MAGNAFTGKGHDDCFLRSREIISGNSPSVLVYLRGSQTMERGGGAKAGLHPLLDLSHGGNPDEFFSFSWFG
jgi:hypothetical protein